MRMHIPQAGSSADQVLARFDQAQTDDVDWRAGRVFSLVYHASAEHEELLHTAHARYSSANLLNPMAFKGLRSIEAEVIQMVASLVHGPPETVGSVTSGGTESILVAMHAYRERARKERRWVRRPELIVPRTIHPAFDKAAHYFGLDLRKVDVDGDMRADVKAMARRIGRSTIGLCASAPQYAHGVVDPIEDIAELAQKHDLPLHVDACIGGFNLPWLEMLGRPIPLWDFRIPGVTSISADLHKYAYAAKGASTLLFRSMDAMRHQFFVATEFPGGIYASPTMLGTRPGGPVAAAWAALVSLGQDGYLELSRRAAEATDRLKDGIRAIPDLELVGDSHGTIVAWTTSEGGPDVYAVADRLEARGWTADRQQRPSCVHHTITANHLPIVDQLLADLAAAVAEVKADPSLGQSGLAPMYGMMAKVPLRGMVGASVRKVLEAMYAPGATVPDLATTGPDGLAGRIMDRYGAQLNRALDGATQLKKRIGKVLGK